ncbi:Oxysterol binding protein [Pichia californica]|uniref:Oxysterol binding protein n=1 Tax=Pichia californica TaxID=460514 RepID=A0A9P6WHF9_9ASCO|nr:Oxysterol binding protein [[Candida] californica]KAG0687240.1 Oxysterol binding protein [[Candida] californica]
MTSAATWTSFIKSIASYNGDLSSLTAPPFILSPTSLVEYSQYWSEHVDLLLEPNFIKKIDNEPIELTRMIAVTKWFISTLKSQYCSRNETLGGEKKPLNPFLGEIFVGKWDDNSINKNLGETILISEQVSHHPPITAYAVENKLNNTILEGYNGVRASMSSTALNVKQFGHALLEFRNLNENYLITLPPLHIEGILAFSPFVELEQKSIIQSSAGYYTIIEYTGRGYFSGKKNSFKARIFKNFNDSKKKENALYTISGQWSEKSTISKGSSTPSSSKDEIFFDALNNKPQHLTVKSIDDQHPLESRKAWLNVANAIRIGDYDLIHSEKSKLENNQRDLRKIEEKNNSKWSRRWFDEIDYSKFNNNDNSLENDIFINLSKLAHLSIKNVASGVDDSSSKNDDVDTMLHWRFVPENFDNETEIKI